MLNMLIDACAKPSFAQQVAHATIGGAIVLTVGVIALAAVLVLLILVLA